MSREALDPQVRARTQKLLEELVEACPNVRSAAIFVHLDDNTLQSYAAVREDIEGEERKDEGGVLAVAVHHASRQMVREHFPSSGSGERRS